MVSIEFPNIAIGGLSSYSTVIIIVAYMNYYGLKSTTNNNNPMVVN